LRMDQDVSRGSGGSMEKRLDSLFAAYRNAFPDPDPRADFMPRLWREIDARRSSIYVVRRWTRALVTAAAGVCLLLGVLLTVSHLQNSVFFGSTYLEALAEDGPPEPDVCVDLTSADNGGGLYQ